MVDINVEAQVSQLDYLSILAESGMRPGSWNTLRSLAAISEIALKMQGTTIDSYLKQGKFTLGSSVVGSLAAFSRAARREVEIVVAVGIGSHNALSRVIGTSFLDMLRKYLSTVRVTHAIGDSEVCLCLYHKGIPDRTMFSYQGLSPRQFSLRPASLSNTTALISAFELARGLIAIEATELRSRNVSLAIGLGDKKILTKRLCRTIRGLIRDRVVSYIFGDTNEYRQLLDQVNHNSDIIESLCHYSRRSPTTYLMTAGAVGMYAVSTGKVEFLPSRLASGLVNTNGAGDAATGGFLSEHLRSSNLKSALLSARTCAEAVLTSPSSLVECPFA